MAKPIKLTFAERIFPLMCTSRYNDIYKKINSYMSSKLGIENFLRESDEFERLKKYVFNKQELYVFENMDRFKSRVLSKESFTDGFDYDDFKKAYMQTLTNQKLLDVIT
jgi:hypothetical protein